MTFLRRHAIAGWRRRFSLGRRHRRVSARWRGAPPSRRARLAHDYHFSHLPPRARATRPTKKCFMPGHMPVPSSAFADFRSARAFSERACNSQSSRNTEINFVAQLPLILKFYTSLSASAGLYRRPYHGSYSFALLPNGASAANALIIISSVGLLRRRDMSPARKPTLNRPRPREGQAVIGYVIITEMYQIEALSRRF